MIYSEPLNYERAKIYFELQTAALAKLAVSAVAGSVVDSVGMTELLQHSYPLQVQQGKVTVPKSEEPKNNVGVVVLLPGETSEDIDVSEYMANLSPDVLEKLTRIVPADVKAAEPIKFFSSAFAAVLPMQLADSRDGLTVSYQTHIQENNDSRNITTIRSRTIQFLRAGIATSKTATHEAGHEDFMRKIEQQRPSFLRTAERAVVAAWTERDSYRANAQVAQKHGELEVFDKETALNYLCSTEMFHDSGLSVGHKPNITRLVAAIDSYLDHPSDVPVSAEINMYLENGLLG